MSMSTKVNGENRASSSPFKAVTEAAYRLVTSSNKQELQVRGKDMFRVVRRLEHMWDSVLRQHAKLLAIICERQHACIAIVRAIVPDARSEELQRVLAGGAHMSVVDANGMKLDIIDAALGTTVLPAVAVEPLRVLVRKGDDVPLEFEAKIISKSQVGGEIPLVPEPPPPPPEERTS